MGAGEVVVVEPGGELLVAFFGVGVVANVSPLAQRGLNEAFGFAIGAGSVGAGEAVADAEFFASGAKAMGAIAGSVVGEQASNGDAVLGVESQGGAQEGDGGVHGLVGQHAGEGEAGVIVDGDVKGLPAGELGATATASVAANGNALIASHALDVEMEHVSGSGMFIAHHRGCGMEMTPAVQMSALQNAADGGGTELGDLGDAIGGIKFAPQGDDFFGPRRRSPARAAEGARRTIKQAGRPWLRKRCTHLAAVFGVTLKLAAANFNVTPPATCCTKSSRRRRVSRAFLWMSIRSLLGSRLLSTISFSGFGRMDNVLKDHRCPTFPQLRATTTGNEVQLICRMIPCAEIGGALQYHPNRWGFCGDIPLSRWCLSGKPLYLRRSDAARNLNEYKPGNKSYRGLVSGMQWWLQRDEWPRRQLLIQSSVLSA
jgi:hypothetical protein